MRLSWKVPPNDRFSSPLFITIYARDILLAQQASGRILAVGMVVLNVIGVVLFSKAAVRLGRRDITARKYSVASMLFLAFCAVVSIFKLFFTWEPADRNLFVLVIAALLVQTVLYALAASYLTFSQRVIAYFTTNQEPKRFDPPPPPTFDD